MASSPETPGVIAPPPLIALAAVALEGTGGRSEIGHLASHGGQQLVAG